MQAALTEHGVSLHAITYCDHLKKVVDNSCLGLDPPRNGGQVMPSRIEKHIVDAVEHYLREQRCTVFPDDVLMWASGAIEGIVYANYILDGKPNRG